ncbi:histone acetyltransferases subunit 3-domain-containing protein [Mucidula mucida]|nr:histone acetyltransferases subunit 3-domain-containing protein [Mucidula mucida]
MHTKLTVYPSPPPLRSSLLRSMPEALPAVSELKSLENELQTLKTKLKERGKKAGADIKVIEESMRRMKESEKGKAKSVDKVKRERDFTPMPEAEEPRLPTVIIGKPRLTSHPLQAGPSSSRSSVDPRSMAEDKKKKKRKREYEDIDLEPLSQRNRKGTPPVIHHTPAPQAPPMKAQKSVPSASTSSSKPEIDPRFIIPATASLLPPRPPIAVPPIPGPSKPIEVMDDFSKLKQPQQTNVNTFYTSIEPWIRNIREEDIGFLEHSGDDVEPFVLPKLGRHYQDIWYDQDMGRFPAPNEDAPPDLFAAPKPEWDPSSITNDDCEYVENRGHGPLLERVISALLPLEPQPNQTKTWRVKDAEDAMEGRPGGSGAAASKKQVLTVADLETRIRDTMRYHGLLTEIPDYSEKVDDPIATAIREGQRELRAVMARNKARRARLVDIARDRLAYQEYVELRDSIDKNINNAYSKLQRKDVPKPKKKKSGAVVMEVNGGSSPPQVPPCPAALGLGPDVENHLVVSEQLKSLVNTRRQWVDHVGSVFDQKQETQPGRVWGVPKTSIYEGLEEEVETMLTGRAPAPMVNGNAKGKGRAIDDMDVG